MGAPSSKPRLLHFVREPRKQRMDALSTANVNLVRIHPITSPILFPHFTEILSPSFFKNTLASPPNIPSTEQHTGVKRALLSSQADEYFDFFPFSAVPSTSLGVRPLYDWASVSTTLMSNNASD